MSGNGAQTGMTRNIMKPVPVRIRKGRRKEQTVLYGAVVGAAKTRVYAQLIVMTLFQPAKSSLI